MVLVLAAGCVVGSSWVGIQLMINPQRLVWMNQFMPDWIPVSVTGLKPPQTRQQLESEIRRSGKIPGSLIRLGRNRSFLDQRSQVTDWLLPIAIQPSNCQGNCQQLAELRVYQSVPKPDKLTSQDEYFQLVSQRGLIGLDESFVMTPLIDGASDSQGSTRLLPFTSFSQFEGTLPKTRGIWFSLSGQWARGDSNLTYGKIIYYYPERFSLSFMLDWSSTQGLPVWHQSGDKQPVLIVDQTIGLEPQIKIYQLKSRNFLPNPLELAEISLLEPAIANDAYRKTLLLARSGLWSGSLAWFRSLKQRHQGRSWPAQAEAQMDLVRRHASITAAQSANTWANPGQQVLVNLIDGRWERALETFSMSPETSLETLPILKADTGRLQRRIEAAIRINPSQEAPKLWGALLLASQKNRATAIHWLKKQPKTGSTTIQRANRLLDQATP